MSTQPVARWRCAERDTTRGALIVLLHDQDSDEDAGFALAARLPGDAAVAALRAPIAGASGFSWFAQWSSDRPIPASLANAVDFVEHWLEDEAGDAEEIWLAGCGGGATLAAALAVHAPQRFAGIALVRDAVPPDITLPAHRDRLRGLEIFVAHTDTGDRADLRATDGACIDERIYPSKAALAMDAHRDLVAWFTARLTPPIPSLQENP